jgi:hypothetical protein
MKTFEGKDEKGKLVYFEITSLLGRWLTTRAISRIQGVEILKALKWFSFRNEDVFCVFKIGEVTFEAWEPWGDSSRFHIGSNPVEGSIKGQVSTRYIRQEGKRGVASTFSIFCRM